MLFEGVTTPRPPVTAIAGLTGLTAESRVSSQPFSLYPLRGYKDKGLTSHASSTGYTNQTIAKTKGVTTGTGWSSGV